MYSRYASIYGVFMWLGVSVLLALKNYAKDI